MHKTIYLDTNIFLHYQPFNQVNWLEIVKAESATIVIPPITVRELNRHKDLHPRPQIKKRAGETIKRLSGLLDVGITTKITEEVFVTFEDRDPIIDYAAHQLNFNVQDDQLIASILVNRLEAPSEHIVLVTSDLGLALVTKAGRQGISTQKMPENLRIADEPDPNESKVKQLEQQIREMNSRVPNLSLVYEDGEQHTTIKLPFPLSIEQSEVEKNIDALKSKFPKRKKKEVKDLSDLPKNAIERASIVGAASIRSMIPQEEFERYNNEVEQYIPAYRNFIASKLEFENQQRRMVKLDIALANDGTAPAEDIDIYMHFPDGFQLLEEGELPSPPQPPDSPVEPMTEIQRMSNSMNHRFQIPTSMLFNPSDISPSLPSNVSSPVIKRVNSYDVHVHVQKIKHNLQEFLDPLFVIFDKYESANSFAIDYSILAANLPHEVTGNLHIVIQREDAN